MKEFGKLKRLDLRSIWPNEARDFTKWLAENIQALGETLGMDLEIESSEASVGDFSLDLHAKDLGGGREVIIENQLTATDHDHLGKLLTYAAGFDASVIVWIAESIREEHRQALDWLNRHTDSNTEFFGVVVEVFHIDDSRPVYNFRPVVFPNDWQRTKRRAATTQVTERAEAYRQFFQALIDELREKHKFTGARLGQPQGWYTFSSGYSGFHYTVSFAQGERVRVELYIDHADAEVNKRIFDEFYQMKDEIENEFGEKFEWERLDNKRGSRIAIYRSGSLESDQEALNDIRAWSIEKVLKLKKVFTPRLKKYSNR